MNAGRAERGPLRLGVGLLVVAGWWTLFGFGAANAARYPVGTAYLPPEAYPANDTPTWLWALFVGAFAGFLAEYATQRALAARIGMGPSTGLSSAVALTGTAAGIFLGAAAFWVPPTTGDGPWEAGARIAWSTRHWVPAALVALALLLVIVATRAMLAHGRRAGRAELVVRAGTRATGRITEVRDTGIQVMNQPRIRYTVAFTDHQNHNHEVTRTDTLDWTSIPRVGDPTAVWFDPARPGEEDSTVVDLTSGLPLDN